MIPVEVVEAANAKWERPCSKSAGVICHHCYHLSEQQARAVITAAVRALPRENLIGYTGDVVKLGPWSVDRVDVLHAMLGEQ